MTVHDHHETQPAAGWAHRAPAPAAIPGSPADLRVTMADAATALTAARADHDELLDAIVLGVRRVVPPLVGAAVGTLGPDGAFVVHAGSGPGGAQLDLGPTERGGGPCVDVLSGTDTDAIHVPDLAVEGRWPGFAARALDAGVHEVLALRLSAVPRAAALVLYAGPDAGLEERDRLVAALYAQQAAVALAGAHRVGRLTDALDSRDVIGRAKGILMERFRIDDPAAFRLLVESSQDTNIKLRAIASWVVQESEERYRSGSGATERPSI